MTSDETEPRSGDDPDRAHEPPREDPPGRGGAPTTSGRREPQEPGGPAVGTLVWGCVVLAVAALLGAWELAGLRLDLSLVVPVGMVVLGLLLVVGAVATTVRSNRRRA